MRMLDPDAATRAKAFRAVGEADTDGVGAALDILFGLEPAPSKQVTLETLAFLRDNPAATQAARGLLLRLAREYDDETASTAREILTSTRR